MIRSWALSEGVPKPRNLALEAAGQEVAGNAMRKCSVSEVGGGGAAAASRNLATLEAPVPEIADAIRKQDEKVVRF